MSILNFAAEAAQSTGGRRNGTTGAQASDRPAAKVWLNAGNYVTVPNEDGTTRQVFINLPLGIAIDTMEKLSAGNTQSVEYAQLVAARNELLAALQAAGDALADGEEREVNLKLVLRKTNAKVNVPTENNPFAVATGNLFA